MQVYFTFDPGAAHMSITYGFVQNKHIYFLLIVKTCTLWCDSTSKNSGGSMLTASCLDTFPCFSCYRKKTTSFLKNILFRFQRQGTNGISWTQPVSAEPFSAHWIARLVLQDTYSSESRIFKCKNMTIPRNLNRWRDNLALKLDAAQSGNMYFFEYCIQRLRSSVDFFISF